MKDERESDYAIDIWKWIAAVLVAALTGLIGTLWTTMHNSVSQAEVLNMIANDREKIVLVTDVASIKQQHMTLLTQQDKLREQQQQIQLTLSRIAVVTGAEVPVKKHKNTSLDEPAKKVITDEKPEKK